VIVRGDPEVDITAQVDGDMAVAEGRVAALQAGLRRFGARGALLVVGLLVLGTIASQPSVPYEWDAASQWTFRAEIERDSPGRILRTMRTPAEWGLLMPDLGTHTYPVGHPIVVGALARLLPEDVSAIRASGVWLTMLAVLLLVQMALRLPGDAGAGAVLPMALVLLSPFAIVHWRSGYVDIVVGLLGALLVVAMDAAVERPRAGRLLWMAVVATLLLQTKQDGAVICLAAGVAVLASGSSAATGNHRLARWRTLGLWAIVFVINVAGWAWLLRELLGPDMPPAPRTFAGVAFGVAPAFAFHVVRHALDVYSWGLVWPLLVVVAIWRRDWRWPIFAATVLVVYGVIHMAAPPQMMVFVRDGMVMNRLLLQMAVASVPLTLTLRSNRSGRDALRYPDRP
jgi:hypothetical protein